MLNKFLSIALIPMLVLTGCASKDANIRGGAYPGSADEQRIGQQIHAEILATFHTYTEPGVVDYIGSVFYQLIPHAERQELSYRYTVLYSEKIYATSAPGGYVYVTTGLLNFLDNESELAAVMANEIGHLQNRDPRLSFGRKALNAVTNAGAIAAPFFGYFGALGVLALILVSSTVGNKQPDPVKLGLKADARAMNYMVDAGYDPQSYLDVMRKFLHADQETLPYFYDYYQSRPITEERMEHIEKVFSELPLEGKELIVKYPEYQEMTKGIREIYVR